MGGTLSTWQEVTYLIPMTLGCFTYRKGMAQRKLGERHFKITVTKWQHQGLNPAWFQSPFS